jgi:hypothetical protein
MALTSPGVQVSVIDESFYTPAEPGTVPMIFVATAQNKANAAGTGTAQGTLKANAGRPYLLTSQRDLADTFGDPAFQIDSNNNPIHGSELNEYGLQAAYSLLGVSNRAWVVRADIDLGELEPTAIEPAANPVAGTYWFDTADSVYGIFEWNGANINTTGGQTFASKTPVVITDTADVVDYAQADYTPKGSVGAIGSYAVVSVTSLNKLWYKNASGTWVEVGSTSWTKSWPTIKGTEPNSTATLASAGNIEINGSSIAVENGDGVSVIADNINSALISGVTAAAVDGYLEIYSDGTGSAQEDSSAGGDILIGGTPATLTLLGITAGTYFPPAVQVSAHTSIPSWKISDTSLGQPSGFSARPTGSVWFKTTSPNRGANLSVKLWNAETLLWDTIDTPLYDNSAAAIYGMDPTSGGSNLGVGDLYAKTNVADDTKPLATFSLYRRANNGSTVISSNPITASNPGAGTFQFAVSSTDNGSAEYSTPYTVTVTTTGSATGDATEIASKINAAGIQNVSASVDASKRIVIEHALGGEIKFTDTDGMLNDIGYQAKDAGVDESQWTANLYYQDGTTGTTSPKQMIASNWNNLTYTASADQVTSLAEDGQLWYSSVVDEVDIMIHDGNNWRGYQTQYADSDPEGPIVAASMPTAQSDGTLLVTGDIWIDTSDLENYPTIYVYNADLTGTISQKWGTPLDKSDQTTENGVLFADARYGDTGGTATTAPSATIPELLVSDYLDPDAPDPALYPKGMLLWNLRRSGFNVKRFERNYINLNADNTRYSPGGVDEDMGSYYPHRWVTESGNQNDGSGSFGRKAQRKVVVQALQAVVNNNDEVRDDESRLFNLMATPGYPELIGEMISLNFDRGLTAFIVGDSPMRLTPDATSLNDWATNVNAAVEDNDDGLVSRDEYLGVFYPAGFTSDNFGNNVVVPASHMMLRTIALSDQVSYPWFAPAGTRRGGITNASSTGYINNEGEFVSVALNEGQRDTLYQNNINPITFISGAGLVAFGQKTRARGASALDRINVARLVIYLRSQLNQLAKPYIFEPNDKITRDEIKQAAESLLLELVGQRALYDYLVVCDESNNTPSRIDRNELYLDIAIEPVKAVEFIYIPLRLKNTGEIAGL